MCYMNILCLLIIRDNLFKCSFTTAVFHVLSLVFSFGLKDIKIDSIVRFSTCLMNILIMQYNIVIAVMFNSK